MKTPELQPPGSLLQEAIAALCDRDPDFVRIEAEAGPVLIRSWPPTFASLVRIIVGQQLSSKAAQAIFERLHQLAEVTPAGLVACPPETLQQAGLSRAKIATCKDLSVAIADGTLPLDTFATLSDTAIATELTRIKGIGIWTAEIYLLFCLERLNSFPASDLAIQESYRLLKHGDRRPTRKELLALTASLSPWRGAAAHLLWHYYRHCKVAQVSS